MVSLIFVSHSNELAKITSKYVKEITKAKNKIAFCGGIGDDKSEYGTDPTDILNAIEEVYDEDGIIIFCDMGSALISSELSISMLDAEKSRKVKITSAPFVEGGVVAAIQSSLNKNMNDIILESLESLSGKKSYVDYEDELKKSKDKADKEKDEDFFKDYKRKEYKIKSANGLHARPVFQLTDIAANSKSSVYIANKTKNKGPVPANSVTKITLLNMEYEDIMEAYSKGPDTEEVFKKIKDLIESEKSPPNNKIPNSNNSKLQVICEGKAKGLGIYVDFNVDREIVENDKNAENAKREKEKLSEAIDRVRNDIIEQKSIIEKKDLKNNESLIFETHLSILYDEALLEEVNNSIEKNKYKAAYAYYEEMIKVFESFDELEDGYMKERKYDIKDILNQVLRYLLNIDIKMPKEDNFILIADDIYASSVPKILNKAKAVISKEGSAFSHASILLKSLDIPYIICGEAKKFDGKEINMDTASKDVITTL